MSPSLSAIMFALLTFACIFVSANAGPGVVPNKKLNDGNEMPTFGLGTWLGQFNAKPLQEEVTHVVEYAIDAGYRQFDTSPVYGDEDQVGRGIANKIKDGTVKREEVFLTTKLWNDRHRQDQVVPALKESLKRLGLEYVDLYLMHWPLALGENNQFLDIDYLETWKGMEEAKKKGLAKSIGVSNFNEHQLKRLLENSQVKPAVLQIEVHPTLTQKKYVKFAQDSGLVVMAYKPFGVLHSNPSEISLPPKIDDPILTAIADKYGKTTSQIVLRYSIDRGLVPIPKSSNKDRIKQNINIFNFHLTEDEIKKIDEFNQDHRIVQHTSYEEHPYYPYEKVGNPEKKPSIKLRKF